MNEAVLVATIEKLCTLLGFSATSVTLTEGSRRVVSVTLQDSDAAVLFAQQGEPLRAFNTIAHRLVEHIHKGEAPTFLVDVNDFYEKQLEKVRTEVRVLAQRARLFKHNVELEPMNAYERLVVHEMFAKDPEIETHSEGEGKFRHVVLKYRQ